jgi:replicative DNA helicase
MCFNRFLSSLANIPQKILAKAQLDPEQIYRKDKALEFIKKYQDAGYYFDIVDVPRNVTIEEIELRYQEALLRYEPDVVIVDYLSLMSSNALAKEADWLKVGGIAASLHEFARSNRCVMVTAAQLTDIKRNAQGGNSDENKTIGVHRFGRSSLIIHNVDSAIQIETRNNENKLPDMRIHYIKNRKGPLGQGNLIKNFANASLIDVPYDQSDLPGDISANIPDLIKSIQDAKNNKNNG